MEPQMPWYQSAIIRQQIIAALLAILGLTGLSTKLGVEFDIEGIVTTVFGAAAVLIPAWTIITRLFKTNPNLTKTAAAAEIRLVKEGTIPASPTTGGPK